jgi:hypothetical protein
MKLINTVVNLDGTATLELRTTLQRSRAQDVALLNSVMSALSWGDAVAGWQWTEDSLFIDFDRSVGLTVDYRWATPADRAQYSALMEQSVQHFISDFLAEYEAAVRRKESPAS